MDNLCLLVITDGRSCIYDTIESARAFLPDCRWKLIYDDSIVGSGNAENLRRDFPDFAVVGNDDKVKSGFAGAIIRAWGLVPQDAEFVFHLEDDFVFSNEVPISEAMQILEADDRLSQIVFKRQAWSEEEKDAGGIVEMWPDLYEEVETNFGFITRHKLFFSTNPSLYKRSLIDYGWPNKRGSEKVFTDKLIADGKHFAFWGKKFDPPFVTHIGNERTGSGY